jgi:hypothetical protein
MASRLTTGKQTVDLAAPAVSAVRVSRIRRDPPAVARKTVIPDRDERDRRTVVIGVLLFTLAIVIIIAGFAIGYTGWTPQQVTLRV